jgi:hypothetical protein
MLFPEYSVCPQNLIRVCHDCNGKKLTAWRDENGERFILHAYYDWIERDEQIVHARFEVGGQNVRVIYDLRMEPREGRFRRMRRHVIKLGLMERYGSYAEEIVVPAMLAAVDAGDRAAQVRKLFRRMSDRIRANYGANHWHAIAYQAAADSDDFIQHALQRVPHD